MDITPVKKEKLNDVVFAQMKDLLIKGAWKQGERIPSEDDLANKFGVSRITIRQALQRLTSMGLIETRPGKGRFVCVPEVGQLMEQLLPTVYLDDCSMTQVNEFREMMDAWSAKLAAQRATAEDVAEMERNYQAMAKCAKKEKWQEFAMLDLDFHVKIGQSTHNTLITRTYGILYDVLRNSMVQIVERMGFRALEFHRQLIDAIAAHDAVAAEEIARNHVENNRYYIG